MHVYIYIYSYMSICLHTDMNRHTHIYIYIYISLNMLWLGSLAADFADLEDVSSLWSNSRLDLVWTIGKTKWHYNNSASSWNMLKCDCASGRSNELCLEYTQTRTWHFMGSEATQLSSRPLDLEENLRTKGSKSRHQTGLCKVATLFRCSMLLAHHL